MSDRPMEHQVVWLVGWNETDDLHRIFATQEAAEAELRFLEDEQTARDATAERAPTIEPRVVHGSEKRRLAFQEVLLDLDPEMIAWVEQESGGRNGSNVFDAYLHFIIARGAATALESERRRTESHGDATQ